MKGNKYVVHLMPVREYAQLKRFLPGGTGSIQKEFTSAEAAIRWVGRICKKQRKNPWEYVQVLKCTGRTCSVESLMFVVLQK